MIAYDGSASSEAIFEDLPRAGLPPNGKALVVVVADITRTPIPVPAEIRQMEDHLDDVEMANVMMYTRRETQRIKCDGRSKVAQGGERLRMLLPQWTVENRVEIGEPANKLLMAAEDWKPDLLVIGSHGRSAIGRFFLGSVSKEVAKNINRAIRVVRVNRNEDENASNRILVGAKTLPDMERILRVLEKRAWPDRTEVQMIAVDDGVSANRISAVYPYGKAIFEHAAEGLVDKVRSVSVDVKGGDLKSVVLDEAENRNADSIFVVANSKPFESGLDETAQYMVTGARCTVELVR